MAIFEAVFKESSHFTAEELLDKARSIDRTVSRATVYRTLPILVESSLVREVDIGTNLKYYMPNKEQDPHKAQVICNDCQKIFEIPAPFMEWYASTVSSKLLGSLKRKLIDGFRRLHIQSRARDLFRKSDRPV
jgi:Fur family transcriptional regulator, ferric uptake regulator